MRVNDDLTRRQGPPVTKRGNNEGHVSKQPRPDGRYQAVMSVPGPGGTRTRKFFYGRTRAEAAAKLTKGMRDLQLGLAPVNERTTVAEFLATWLRDTVKPPNKRPATYRGYEANIRLHIVPSLGHIPLAKLTPAHVRRMMNEMGEAKKSPRTIQYARAVLRSALKQAQTDGAVHRNVAELAPGPSVEKAEIHPLTPEQVKAFLDGVAGDRLAALYAVAFTMGLRQSENPRPSLGGHRLRRRHAACRPDAAAGCRDDLRRPEVRPQPAHARDAGGDSEGPPRCAREVHRGAVSTRGRLESRWARVRHSHRDRTRPPERVTGLSGSARASQAAEATLPRRTARVRDVPALAGRPAPRGSGDPRTQPDWHHRGPLRARHAGTAARGHGQDRRRLRRAGLAGFVGKLSRQERAAGIVRRQKAELVVELLADRGAAKRYTVTLSGFDLYCESLETGAARNHFKLSLHASGEAHHTAKRSRTPAVSGPSLSVLEAPTAIERAALGGREDNLTWRGSPATSSATRRVLGIDLRVHCAPWIVVLAVPSRLGDRIPSLTAPAGYEGVPIGSIVSDWTEPHMVVAAYNATDRTMEAMNAQVTKDGLEHTGSWMIVGQALPGVAQWKGASTPTARAKSRSTWRPLK